MDITNSREAGFIFKTIMFASILSITPVLAGNDGGINYYENTPKSLADEMPTEDLCQHHVGIAYLSWLGHWVIKYENASITKDDEIDTHQIDDEARCTAVGYLSSYTLDLVWSDSLGLQETELAVLKRCRSLPIVALENINDDYLCYQQNFAALADQSQYTGNSNPGPAKQHFLDLLKKQKSGVSIETHIIADAYWAMMDEENPLDMKAEIARFTKSALQD